MKQAAGQEQQVFDPQTLTPRQREVLRLIARGETNAAIAERLGISLAGAKWHVSEIIGRLGVESREEAAALWREHQHMGRRIARLGGTLVLPKAGWMAVPATASIAVVAAGVLVAVAVFSGGEPASPAAVTTATVTPEAAQAAYATGTPGPTRVVNIYPASAYSECPAGPEIMRPDPLCVTFSEGFALALGRRLVVEFPGTGERFEYFLPPETTSFRPPHPDDLYRPLRTCEHGSVVVVEPFIITAEGELPSGSGAIILLCTAPE